MGIIRQTLKRKIHKSKFLSDHVDSNKPVNEDILDVRKKAENFAEQVIDNFSSESLVFGIDAPWGSGKTTFLRFSRNVWEKHGNGVLIFDFNPQSFDINTNLFDKFVDEFINNLKANHFVPEIQINLFKYLRFLKDSHFDLKFFQFNFSEFEKLSDSLKNLEQSLVSFNKKIIVVIDDLDRLQVDDIKIVLNIVKKSFALPNVSYVLCYDTENINSFENKLIQTKSTIKLNNNVGTNNVSKIEGGLSTIPMVDNRKISEFFEKVVNVKISLFPNPEKLKTFFIDCLKKIGIEEKTIGYLTTDAINFIFHADNYHSYRPFIGDLRKIKRFINTFVLLKQFDGIDITYYDFNGKDLINLFLIYINYPHIFRKIYDTETNSGKHFFSAVSPYEVFISGKDTKKFENSPEYFSYLDTLNDTEKILVEKVFTINKRLESTDFSSIDPQTLKTFACFNGTMGTGRNLEPYLNFIINGDLPPIPDNYNSYLKKISELKLKDSLEEIISEDKEFFDLAKGEKSHINLFNAIIENIKKEVEPKEIQKIITYILEHIQDYSLLHTNDDGFEGYRDDLSYKLIYLLDRGGWQDQDGKTYSNTPENLKQIANWIFGEDSIKKDAGIINILSRPERGILGIYDLCLFRLACSHDRQGSIYNIYTALAKHYNKDAKTDGLITDLAVEEMREISQLTYSIFKDRFILPNKNFILEVQKIDIKDLMGKTYPLFEKGSDADKALFEERAMRVRNKITSFIIYQLSNSLVNMGVGCGYYDTTGNTDKGGIRDEMNTYLFDVCFNIDKDIKNAEFFVDYLMINFSKSFAEHGSPKFLKNVIEEVIYIERLKEYWLKNRDKIKKELGEKKKEIKTLSFDLNYSDNLKSLYEELDKIFSPSLEEKKTLN